MSLFDDNITKPQNPPSHGSAKTAEELFYEVLRRDFLSHAENERLKKLYEFNLHGGGLISLMPTLMSNDGVIVDISNVRKLFPGGVPEHPIDPYRTKNGDTIVLGEYRQKPREQITLYIENIRFAALENNMQPELLLVSVFAHELYHAYFHKEAYVPELEEPLAEFGSLLYINTLYSIKEVEKNELELMVKMIEEKTGAIRHYRLGAYLFQLTSREESLPKIIEKYKNLDLSRLSDSGDLTEVFRKYKICQTTDSLTDIFQASS